MEINRIEADRHLIGVGRELESLDGKAKATLPVHVTEDGCYFNTLYLLGCPGWSLSFLWCSKVSFREEDVWYF